MSESLHSRGFGHVLWCDHDYVLTISQILTVVQWTVGTGDLEACTVDQETSSPISGNRIRTPSVKKYQDWLLCLGVAGIFCPNIELQAVLRYRVVVLSCEIFPHAEARRLSEVGKCADWRLVRRTVAVLMSIQDIRDRVETHTLTIFVSTSHGASK